MLLAATSPTRSLDTFNNGRNAGNSEQGKASSRAGEGWKLGKSILLFFEEKILKIVKTNGKLKKNVCENFFKKFVKNLPQLPTLREIISLLPHKFTIKTAKL